MSRRIRKQLVLETVADWYDVGIDAMHKTYGSRHAVFARSVLALVLYRELKLSYADITRYLNHRDHSAVRERIHRFTEKLKTDDDFHSDYHAILTTINEVHTHDNRCRAATVATRNSQPSYHPNPAATFTDPLPDHLG